MNYFIMAFQKYAQFTGRSRRSEYWYFALFYFLISIPLSFLDAMLGIPVSLVWTLGALVPSIAVAIRRMHDVGKSGWFCLIPFYNLYLAVQDSEPGDNQYGPNPKGIGGGDVSQHLV